MSIIVGCSATGSPGVTTSLLGLALTWPRDVLLVDCDRDPSQTIEAGYLRGVPVSGRGLARIALAHREHRDLLDEVRSQAVTLRESTSWQRMFLPGFTHPGAANVFHPVWPGLVGTLQRVSATGIDVLVDAGRIGRDGLPPDLLVGADQVLVVVRSNLRSLAAARLHLPGLQEHHSVLGSRAQLGLLVVGAGRPHSASEISHQFGLAVAGALDFAPEQAEVLTDGAPEPRRFAESGYMRSCRVVASHLGEPRVAGSPTGAFREVQSREVQSREARAVRS